MILIRTWNEPSTHFENSVPHFLDIEICPNGLGIYHKHTLTGQYLHITSYTLWRWKTSWIHSLAIIAKKICSANYFKLIKMYIARMFNHEML